MRERGLPGNEKGIGRLEGITFSRSTMRAAMRITPPMQESSKTQSTRGGLVCVECATGWDLQEGMLESITRDVDAMLGVVGMRCG